MTCIVGYLDKKNKKVILGGDSAAVGEDTTFVNNDSKVFGVGDFIIGCTTSFRMIQLLKFSFKPPKVKKEIFEYMCTDFVNAVRECFIEGGFMETFENGSDKGGCFLVGYKNRLFRIEEDFAVFENANGIDAVGCGDEFALGALHTISDQQIKSDDKVIKALQTAAYYSNGVCEPFYIIST